jgi:hypothetical protein
VLEVYLALSNAERNNRPVEDVSNLLKQTLCNLTDYADDKGIVHKCFRLLEVAAMDFAELFIPQFSEVAKQARVRRFFFLSLRVLINSTNCAWSDLLKWQQRHPA